VCITTNYINFEFTYFLFTLFSSYFFSFGLLFLSTTNVCGVRFVVDGGHEDEEHLLVDLVNVLRNDEHHASGLLGEGDGVFGVHFLVCIGLTCGHAILPVDFACVGRKARDEMDEHDSTGEFGVTELGDFVFLRHFAVGPLEDILFSFVTEELEVGLAD